jgi:hypothetical protein
MRKLHRKQKSNESFFFRGAAGTSIHIISRTGPASGLSLIQRVFFTENLFCFKEALLKFHGHIMTPLQIS